MEKVERIDSGSGLGMFLTWLVLGLVVLALSALPIVGCNFGISCFRMLSRSDWDFFNALPSVISFFAAAMLMLLVSGKENAPWLLRLGGMIGVVICAFCLVTARGVFHFLDQEMNRAVVNCVEVMCFFGVVNFGACSFSSPYVKVSE